MKLHLDENLSPRVAEMLRAAGSDAMSAYDVGNTQLDDRAQLAYATREGRAMVTCDVADFVELAAEAIRANTEHAGIMLISSQFGTDEFASIAKGIGAVVRRYPNGIHWTVVYVTRPARSDPRGSA